MIIRDGDRPGRGHMLTATGSCSLILNALTYDCSPSLLRFLMRPGIGLNSFSVGHMQGSISAMSYKGPVLRQVGSSGEIELNVEFSLFTSLKLNRLHVQNTILISPFRIVRGHVFKIVSFLGFHIRMCVFAFFSATLVFPSMDTDKDRLGFIRLDFNGVGSTGCTTVGIVFLEALVRRLVVDHQEVVSLHHQRIMCDSERLAASPCISKRHEEDAIIVVND